MKYFYMYILVVFLSSCSSDVKDKNEINCNITALDFYLDTNTLLEQIEVEKDRKGQDSIRLEVIKEVMNLYESIVEKSGGINENGYLFNGCHELITYKDTYDDFRKTRLDKLYKGLSLENSRSKTFISLMNSYFYEDNKVFNESYFKKSRLFHFTTELLILEIGLLTVELKNDTVIAE